jgi:hypothetical protein
MATAIPPGDGPANWQVIFFDFRNHHDWIGRAPIKNGGVLKKHRKKLPPKQKRDFYTREAAEQFVANLRHDIGADEVAATIIDLSAPPPTPAPKDRLLPGDWPFQTRG